MKVHILHDWFDTLRNLLCLSKLDGHDVKVWTDHEPDPLVLFRERTKVRAQLLEGMPSLKLIS